MSHLPSSGHDGSVNCKKQRNQLTESLMLAKIQLRVAFPQAFLNGFSLSTLWIQVISITLQVVSEMLPKYQLIAIFFKWEEEKVSFLHLLCILSFSWDFDTRLQSNLIQSEMYGAGYKIPWSYLGPKKSVFWCLVIVCCINKKLTWGITRYLTLGVKQCVPPDLQWNSSSFTFNAARVATVRCTHITKRYWAGFPDSIIQQSPWDSTDLYQC